jgi:hypothetical protein
MIPRLPVLASTLLVVAFVTEVRAQGTITWAAGFPKTGAAIGEIDIKGTITPDAGWTISSARAEAWEVGKVVFTSDALALNINAVTGVGTFDQAYALTAGKTYNVVVNAILTDGTNTKTIRTKPGSAMAKAN